MSSSGRIVLVVPVFPQVSETFILSKVLGLSRRGWDVHVVCDALGDAPRGLDQLDRETLSRVVHKTGDLSRWQGAASRLGSLSACLLRGPSAALAVAQQGGLRALAREATILMLKPAVVHFEFGSLARKRAGAIVAGGSRVVVSFRGFDLAYAGLEDPAYYESVWAHADALHFLGDELRALAHERGYAGSLPEYLIPPGVDVRGFQPGTDSGASGSNGRETRLLSVGRLHWKKGHEYAVEALALVRAMGIEATLDLVGEGEMREAIGFAASQLNVAQHVRFLGALPPEKVRQAYESADIFVHLAVSEGFCNAVLEAQAMQLPVVCSDALGLRENVANEETGLVVPRRDARAAAEAIGALATDGARRLAMGRAGRARVIERFSVESQLDSLERMYETVLSEPPRGRT